MLWFKNMNHRFEIKKIQKPESQIVSYEHILENKYQMQVLSNPWMEDRLKTRLRFRDQNPRFEIAMVQRPESEIRNRYGLET